MSPSTPTEHSPPAYRGAWASTIALWFALIASALPLVRVIGDGSWVIGVLAVCFVVLATGWGARRLSLPALVVSLGEIVAWAIFVVVVFLSPSAFWGVIPTPRTIDAVGVLTRSAAEEISLGAAPLEPTAALSFVVVAAMGLLAIAMDHVVLTARMPLLAAVGLVAISLIPQIVVPGEFDVGAFAMLATSIVCLIRFDTRRKDAALSLSGTDAGPANTTAPAPRTIGVATFAIGAMAVVLAMVITPLITPPDAPSTTGTGTDGVSINPNLRLGDDLRNPAEIEVLTVRAVSNQAPYLRAATLSTLEGAVWSADEWPASPVDDDPPFGTTTLDADIAVAQDTIEVDVTGLVSSLLPISGATTSLGNLEGAWQVMAENTTVQGEDVSTRNQTYTIGVQSPEPSREQMQAREASGSPNDGLYTDIPERLPENISQAAAEVTANETNDYDRLIALQRWFRGSDFTYSLNAPVEEGFDGSGLVAVSRFLDVGAGYCVHFASAFTLMARSLDMPTRIVIGYLPGTATGEIEDDQRVYSVASTQLHSWPEVYFEGVGWVGFEPTKSLGVATNFSSSSVSESAESDPLTPAETEDAAAPTPTPSASGSADFLQDGVFATGAENNASGVLLGLGVLLLVALALPSVGAAVRRAQLLRAARDGDARAAWAVVVHTAIDLGIAVPASMSPRGVGSLLRDEGGASEADIARVVSAVEHAAYAPAGSAAHRSREGAALARSVRATRRSMLESASPPRRVVAGVWPRSLLRRTRRPIATQ